MYNKYYLGKREGIIYYLFDCKNSEIYYERVTLIITAFNYCLLCHQYIEEKDTYIY